MVYCFEAIITSRRFHVYKETTRSNVKVGGEVKVEVESNLKSITHDPYSCAIKTKHEHYVGWKTVGHIPREISRYVYFFIKQEGGRVYGKLKSLKYKPSPIPAGGLEVPLLLKFEAQEKWVTDAMEEFVENFYSFDFAGDLVVDNDDEGEIDFDTIDIEEDSNENDSNENDSNENDLNDETESENNEKDGETVSLDDPISTENKELPIVIID